MHDNLTDWRVVVVKLFVGAGLERRL